MRIKQLAAVLAIGISAAGTFNYAQAQVASPSGNTGTQHTTPTAAQRAQQDSINRNRDMESAQPKTEMRNEQRGTATDHDMIQRENQKDANVKPYERDANTQQPPVKQHPNTATQPQSQTRTREATQTKTTTTPSGTTIETERTQTQTHTPGQAPTQTRTSTKTITHPDGRVMTHSYEYYGDNMVVRDNTGKAYYIQNDKFVEITDNNKIEKHMPPDERLDKRTDSNTGEKPITPVDNKTSGEKSTKPTQPQSRP